MKQPVHQGCEKKLVLLLGFRKGTAPEKELPAPDSREKLQFFSGKLLFLGARQEDPGKYTPWQKKISGARRAPGPNLDFRKS